MSIFWLMTRAAPGLCLGRPFSRFCFLSIVLVRSFSVALGGPGVAPLPIHLSLPLPVLPAVWIICVKRVCRFVDISLLIPPLLSLFLKYLMTQRNKEERKEEKTYLTKLPVTLTLVAWIYSPFSFQYNPVFTPTQTMDRVSPSRPQGTLRLFIVQFSFPYSPRGAVNTCKFKWLLANALCSSKRIVRLIFPNVLWRSIHFFYQSDLLADLCISIYIRQSKDLFACLFTHFTYSHVLLLTFKVY